MPIVDNAIYVGGVRGATQHSLEETLTMGVGLYAAFKRRGWL